MYSQPRAIGATMFVRFWKSELSRATAVTVKGTPVRTSVCVHTVPSVLAYDFSSLAKKSELLTKRTPGTFIAASLAASRRATFSSTGMVNGSTR